MDTTTIVTSSSVVERVLARAANDGRKQLLEHEAHDLVHAFTGCAPPTHVFVPRGETLTRDVLASFRGTRVVLKVVSPDVVHKTEARGVVFVANQLSAVRSGIAELERRLGVIADVRGVLVVEALERPSRSFGDELFVGLRATREFGPVLAAGLGGVDTEYFAERMSRGAAIAKAVALETDAERFFELFARTAAYDALAGRMRGRERLVGDDELVRCFAGFLELARAAFVARDDAGFGVDGGTRALVELEVNPFAAHAGRLTPLDARGRLGAAVREPAPRPKAQLERLFEPRSIAVLGVSATAKNFGRIILDNVLACGFPLDRVFVIKPGVQELCGVRCVPSLEALPERVDLVVLAAAAAQLPELVRSCVASGRVESAILVPGGVGEIHGTTELAQRVRAEIAAARALDGPTSRDVRVAATLTAPATGGPVFLGPNSLGVLSRAGRYDTLFIPSEKVDKGWSGPPRRVALLSQSGAFVVGRLSKLETLRPALAVSIGNQLDVTVADCVRAAAERDDVDVLGVYVEGFQELDGLAFVRAVRAATCRGKDVIFYKAGRSELGRCAAAGHTASLAGDHEVAEAAAEQAGALVAESFEEFEEVVELCAALHERVVPRGRTSSARIGVISNAGYEAVGMADAVRGPRHELTLPSLDDTTHARLTALLRERGLAGIVDVKNPLDLTPQANEDAYLDALEAFLASDSIDAVVVGCVPLTSRLATTPDEIAAERSLAHRLPRAFAATPKPVVVVIDSGPRYEPLVHTLRSGGLPVFRSADRAMHALGRWVMRPSSLSRASP